jgi:hypothetical protein
LDFFTGNQAQKAKFMETGLSIELCRTFFADHISKKIPELDRQITIARSHLMNDQLHD